MPPLTSSIPDMTTSSNGRNVRPNLQPKSHFFIEDTGGTFTQNASQCFGNVSTTQFKTTSTISFSGNRKIYSICKGQIFIQPNVLDSTKVNLILKPYKQPINEVSIKYFVYRGLNKSDFFTSGSSPVLAGSEIVGTELNKFLWKQFNDFYVLENSGLGAPQFIAEFLGFPGASSTQLGEHLIDSYFFKQSAYTDSSNTIEVAEFAYELPIIPRGIELGHANGTIGIDVVLNTGDYSPIGGITPFSYDLNFARSADHVLDTSGASSTYEAKLIREAVVDFIDIAAFYGLHANGVGKLFYNDNPVALSSKIDIVNKISGFHTKNTQYLYLKGNRQRSYNFYNEHEHPDPTNSNNITFGTNSSVLVEQEFGTNGWPIQVFPSQTTLSLQLIYKQSEQPIVYLRIGELETTNNNNFIDQNYLIQKNHNNGIITNENYTTPIELKIETEGGNAIASYFEIIFDGPKSSFYLPGETTPYVSKRIDRVFDLINANPFFKTNTADDLPVVVGYDIQLISFKDSRDSKQNGTVKIKRIEDKIENETQNYTERIVYETFLDQIEFNSVSSQINNMVSVESFISKTHKNTENNFYRPALPYSLQNVNFRDGNSDVRGVLLRHPNQERVTKKMVALTKGENQLLLDLVTLNNLNNARIFFLNVEEQSSSFYLTTDNLKYQTTQLAIVGEDSNGVLNLYRPATPVKVYTLDEAIYFSKGYSESMPESELENFNTERPE